ncbi:MAG TPA: hypothetical protein VIT62_11000 [Lysobacter sp.]
MKWRKRYWRDAQNDGPSPHYWLLKTPLGEVLAACYLNGWTAAISYIGTDTDAEIGWGRNDEECKRSAERQLRRMSARLARLVADGR